MTRLDDAWAYLSSLQGSHYHAQHIDEEVLCLGLHLPGDLRVTLRIKPLGKSWRVILTLRREHEKIAMPVPSCCLVGPTPRIAILDSIESLGRYVEEGETREALREWWKRARDTPYTGR